MPDSAGSSCVLERDQCPSNSHREGGSCVCDACYQGNPNGNGEGCTPTPSCATCAHPLETGASGTCECIPGISKVCGPTSMNYTVTVMGQEVRGEQCCRPDDPCGWGGDGFCDCNGECSFDNADCAAPATATPVCAARNPGNCGNEVWAGRCVDNLLIWCDDRTVPGSPYVSYYNCPDYMAGYVCGADTVNGGFNCVERRSNCGDVPSSGRCNGTTAQYCDDGVLQTVDCEGRGCGPYTYMGGMVEFCLPCPPNATYNEADNTCSCNSGYVPDEAGSACVSSGGGGGGDTACDGGACPEDAEEECACARVEDRAVPGVLGLFLLALVRGRRRA